MGGQFVGLYQGECKRFSRCVLSKLERERSMCLNLRTRYCAGMLIVGISRVYTEQTSILQNHKHGDKELSELNSQKAEPFRHLPTHSSHPPL